MRINCAHDDRQAWSGMLDHLRRARASSAGTMLNKGPHIVETLRFLADVFRRMQAHQEKKSPMLRALAISEMAEG